MKKMKHRRTPDRGDTLMKVLAVVWLAMLVAGCLLVYYVF